MVPWPGLWALERGAEPPLPCPTLLSPGCSFPAELRSRAPSLGKSGAVSSEQTWALWWRPARTHRGAWGASPGWPSGVQGCRQCEHAGTRTDPHGTRCTCECSRRHHGPGSHCQAGCRAPQEERVLGSTASQEAGPSSHPQGWSGLTQTLPPRSPPPPPGTAEPKQPLPHTLRTHQQPEAGPGQRARQAGSRGSPTLDGSRGSRSTPRTCP